MNAHILVIQNEEHGGLGHLEEAFTAAGLTWRTVHAWDQERVPSTIAPHIGLVLLGGPQHVYHPEQWPYLDRQLALVREAHAVRAPVLGICLGAQLVAQALGGHVHPGAQGFEGGYTKLELTDAGEADAMTAPFHDAPAMMLHGDTFELPPGATHLAKSDAYAAQAFRIGDRTYGLQFHPEFTAAQLEAILPQAAKDLHDAKLTAATILADARRHEPAVKKAAHALAQAFRGCGCFD